jgi:digeranylgeranylglycerophospholipid reductase
VGKGIECDVAVVGAGPAGLSAARAAASQELDVVVLERSPEIGHMVHTSGATWIEQVEKHGLDSKYYNAITKCTIASPHTETVVKTSSKLICILDVRRSYQRFAELAAQAGAKVLLRSKVAQAIVEDKAVRGVRAAGVYGAFDVRAKVTIDASGFPGIIGQNVGLIGKCNRFGVGAEYEAWVENWDSEAAALLVGSTFSPAGYAWIFPVGKNRVRIGVGIGWPESEVRTIHQLDRLAQERPGPLRTLGRIVPFELHFGIVPNAGIPDKSVANGLVLVGDSASQVNPMVLDGIRFALRYGEMAGRVASEAIRMEDTSERFLAKYDHKWRKEVGRDFKIGHLIQKRFLSFKDEEWDGEVERLADFSGEEFLEIQKGLFSVSNILGLAMRHPKFAAGATFKTLKEML